MKDNDRSAHLSRRVDQSEIDQIFATVWETAARINCMLLARMSPDYAFDQLREMIRDCLSKGLSATETRDHVVKELLRSATLDSQPRNTCDDSASQDQRGEQPAS